MVAVRDCDAAVAAAMEALRRRVAFWDVGMAEGGVWDFNICARATAKGSKLTTTKIAAAQMYLFENERLLRWSVTELIREVEFMHPHKMIAERL